jgi:excinuclease UvrABC ATPase subunit
MVATYIQIGDFIRQIYLKEAQKIGLEYKIGHFSYNSEGACEKCGGEGEIVIAGASHICDRCEGTKFKKEILDITYSGLNINEIQKITVTEALSLFQDDKIRKVLETLNDLCLGYLTLGQSTKTISGGEAQRIKLAVELCTQNAVDFLYVLDEPTAGLSCHDILALSDILKRLVAKGNTVIVIEHDLQMLTLCDHIIEIGPKSGVNGGRIIAEGSIGSIIANENSIIAPYFQQFLNSLEGNK